MEENALRDDSGGLDPRARIVQAVALSITIAVLRDLPAVTCGLLLGPVVSFLLNVRLRDILPRLAAANLFVVFLWLVLPFSLPGQAVFEIGPLAATIPGIELALLITLKANAIMILFLALVCPLSITQISNALDDLKISPKICSLLTFTFRFIFVLDNERRRLLRAARNRGFRPGTNVHTYRTYAQIIGMVLVHSWERAERVQRAMLCRGFSGRYPRTRTYRLHRRDIFHSLFAAAAIAGMILLQEPGGWP